VQHIVRLEAVGPQDRDAMGGKAVSLGELCRLGMRVPPGFAIGTTAYLRALDASGHRPAIADLLGGLNVDDLEDVTVRCAEVRRLITEMPVDPDVERAIRRGYEDLEEACGIAQIPVAVRSSARGEDSAGASFAGEHDTFLWVSGVDAVVSAVRKCWASLFTDRATCYRVEMGIDAAAPAMGVVVQKMVRSSSGGVAFTLDPSNGDRSAIAIDSAWGFGEGVVSGDVTPDSFLVDKVTFTIVRRVISVKAHEYRLGDTGEVQRLPIDDERSGRPSLSDEQAIALARLARQLERTAGRPQDVEWAVDADLVSADDHGIVLLQCRPETVWSERLRNASPKHAPADLMSGIVSTLMSPLHARPED
jgi:pyruvate,water dikinase